MRKNFTCKFNGYVTPDNREGIIRSIVSQLQGYDCDPEVTLTDNGIIVSATVNGDLTPSLIRDKLAFNYFITSVSTGDTIRKIKKMVLPKTEATQFKNVSPFVDPKTLDEHVTSTLDTASAGPARSFTMGDQEYMLNSRTSHFNGVGHPVPGTIPELLRHLQDHHPVAWEELKDYEKQWGQQGSLESQTEENFRSLTRLHLEALHNRHPEGIGGDHPHHHREELDTDHFSDIDTELGLHQILTTPVTTPTTTPTTTILSSWVKQADPTGDMLPGIFTGDGPKDEFIIDGATEIKTEDVNGPRNITKLMGGSKLVASVGDANGPSLGLYSLPHETVSVEDSMGAAPEGTGLPRFDSMISDPGPVAIPNTSLNSGFHDRTILNPVGKPRAESLGVPIGLAAFRRIGLEDKIEDSLDIPVGAGGSGITNIIGQPITDWSTRPQVGGSKILLGLSDDFDDEDESDDEDEF